MESVLRRRGLSVQHLHFHSLNHSDQYDSSPAYASPVSFDLLVPDPFWEELASEDEGAPRCLHQGFDQRSHDAQSTPYTFAQTQHSSSPLVRLSELMPCACGEA